MAPKKRSRNATHGAPSPNNDTNEDFVPISDADPAIKKKKLIVMAKEGCLHFVIDATMVEAKKMEVVNPIGRFVGFACVGSPFQLSLELCLFLDKKCDP
jgi:hypothetical protein